MPLHVEQNSGRLILSIPASGDLPRSWFSGQRMWLWPAHDVDTAPRTNTMLTSVFGALFKPSVTSTHKDLKPQMSGITWRKNLRETPTNWHSTWQHSAVLSDALSDILSDIYSANVRTFYSTFYLASFVWQCISNICSCFWHFVWHTFWHFILQIFWQAFWHSSWYIHTGTHTHICIHIYAGTCF